MPALISDFKTRFSEAMKSQNMKSVDLVNKTNIPKSAVSQYLTGKIKPKNERLSIIAKALSVDEAWLIGFDVPKNSTKKGINIPVLGYVSAGIPIEQIEDVIDYEEISEQKAKSGTFFGLKIKGSSMEPRICNGDTVIVKVQSDVENGEIAIVSVGNSEATCKKILKQHNGIQLVSLNTSYNPVFYDFSQINSIPITIIGKVVELRAKL